MAAALLMSCEQRELVYPVSPDEPVPLRIASGIGSVNVTRAFDTSWEANDQIGVFTVEAGSTDATKITYSGTQKDENIVYSISTGAETYDKTDPDNPIYDFQGFTSASPIYLPADGSQVDVYAYSPWKTGITAAAGLGLTIETTQTAANQKTFDLMMAKDVSTALHPICRNHDNTNAQANLLFEHCLTKVLIRLIVDEGYSVSDFLNKVSVKITKQPTAATFMPLAQTLTVTTATTDFTDIIPATLTSGDPDYLPNTDPNYSKMVYCYRALLLPNEETTNPAVTVTDPDPRKIEFTVTNGSYSSVYTYTINETYAANMQIIYTLKLGSTGLSITAAIQPWSFSTVNPTYGLYEETNE